jgi:nitrite reductase (NADH) small subunit
MPEFVEVMAVAELAEGKGCEVTVANQTLAVFKLAGEFYALGGRCVHRGGPLGQGYLDGAFVVCPWHGWAFDLRTGHSAGDNGSGVPRYETRVQDGHVLVKVD